ncbi:Mitogen-activated protein kinase kinase kinase 13-B [Termitomyces sp. T112]|nr:Mitogen-activated protein kinase kinase kinase 13-B [Termitomyces sp. T112]
MSQKSPDNTLDKCNADLAQSAEDATSYSDNLGSNLFSNQNAEHRTCHTIMKTPRDTSFLAWYQNTTQTFLSRSSRSHIRHPSTCNERDVPVIETPSSESLGPVGAPTQPYEDTRSSATARRLPSALGKLENFKRPRSTALGEENEDSDVPIPSNSTNETENTRNKCSRISATHQREDEGRDDDNLAGPSNVSNIDGVQPELYRDVQTAVPAPSAILLNLSLGDEDNVQHQNTSVARRIGPDKGSRRLDLDSPTISLTVTSKELIPDVDAPMRPRRRTELLTALGKVKDLKRPCEIENSRHTSAAHQTQFETRYDDNLAGPSGVKSIQKRVRRHGVSSFAHAALHHPISLRGGFPTLPSEIWIPDIREYTQPSATRGLPSALEDLKRPRSTALSEGNGDSDGTLLSDNASETDHTRNEGRHTLVAHQRVGEARHDNNLAGPSVVYLTSIESVQQRDVQPVVDEYKQVKALIDHLFQRLSDIVVEPPPAFQRHLIVATQRLAATSGLYPASYELTNVIIPKTSEKSGGFGDVYKGHFRGQEVGIKVLRLYQNEDMGKLMKVFTREAILWSQLRHPNLLPFYGVYSHDGRVSFVAPWMENGDIGEYLKRNQTSNRVVLTIRCMILLKG